MKNLVSIITPTYNDIAFIKATYSSICSQSYEYWEWVVTDDCSTDGTYEMLLALSHKDSRIIVNRNAVNSGAAVSRNSSIDLAKGRFIAFLDADDLWEPDKLKLQVQFMIDEGVSLSYSDYSTIDEMGICLNSIRRVPEKVTYRSLLKENVIGCLTAIYDVDKIGKHYMPLIRKRQDFGLWLKILRSVDSARKCPGVLAKYRVRKNSVSSNKFRLLRYNFELFYKHEGMPLYKSGYYLASNILSKMKKNRVVQRKV
ncbi:glycosyltransferase family 2 protein [Vibrio mediterranei]